MKTYYVYAQGRFNLWALIYTTNSQQQAKGVASKYNKTKISTKKLNN
jgi:hypothetical protein